MFSRAHLAIFSFRIVSVTQSVASFSRRFAGPSWRTFTEPLYKRLQRGSLFPGLLEMAFNLRIDIWVVFDPFSECV